MVLFALTYINGISALEIGIASMCFFLSFGVSVILFATIADKIKGVKDDFLIIFCGFIFRGVIFIFISVVNSIWGFYVIHILLGLSRGLTDSSQEKIISKISSEDFLGRTFGLKIGLVNIAAAAGAALGGIFIDQYGFNYVFIAVGILTIIAGFLFYYNRKVII